MTTLVWFRQDLRLADNPALHEAAERGPILPVYIFEPAEETGESHPLGGASQWWLHHSLQSLKKRLPGLVIMKGDARHLIPQMAKDVGAEAVYWNRCYEPKAIQRDTDLKSSLKDDGFEVKSFKASLLFEPWEMETKSGGPFKVYTPFWKSAQQKPVPEPLAAPDKLDTISYDGGIKITELDLLPRRPNWAAGWEKLWSPGEEGAHQRLTTFLQNELQGYGDLRNRPDLPNVSRLSPHLHFGEISPRSVWHQTHQAAAAKKSLADDAHKFLSEIAWREFSYHLLYHFPKLPEANWRPAFDAYPWQEPGEDLIRWQKGLTGYPIVDAGMRELWRTGYMHNRVRMIAASFLIKHLRIDWRHGEAWFRDTLVDADLANNSAGWQWVAGSGADASPYFRVFNPITQGAKFDPEGTYVRKWVPELAELPTEHLSAPFDAPPAVLKMAGVSLGKDYPNPIVDHAEARKAALAGYDAVKTVGQDAA
ncbi:deoxyribodipyrimidine photo-lyase [Roseibium denhamense]|uniref:Deoxyribodipyrimidine photo-lyase n=1 Tax=Roseibium denhamense TaxID=76305 RepID=A0ABY1NRU7_9HYPH|nr:deoxyribodipyrimidine photo-lyase [Roseibium denhamense]MTI08123.1 deoxyribodipyrimidine photo-lyase [Roseibium denhamense]SMP16598.1 deoxyribodipyrimidine photo-lyase [Roseibium denhamense]